MSCHVVFLFWWKDWNWMKRSLDSTSKKLSLSSELQEWLWQRLVDEWGLDNSMTRQTQLLLDFEEKMTVDQEKVPLPRKLKGNENLRQRDFRNSCDVDVSWTWSWPASSFLEQQMRDHKLYDLPREKSHMHFKILFALNSLPSNFEEEESFLQSLIKVGSVLSYLYCYQDLPQQQVASTFLQFTREWQFFRSWVKTFHLLSILHNSSNSTWHRILAVTLFETTAIKRVSRVTAWDLFFFGTCFFSFTRTTISDIVSKSISFKRDNWQLLSPTSLQEWLPKISIKNKNPFNNVFS